MIGISWDNCQIDFRANMRVTNSNLQSSHVASTIEP